jgi:hypothetical protein
MKLSYSYIRAWLKLEDSGIDWILQSDKCELWRTDSFTTSTFKLVSAQKD